MRSLACHKTELNTKTWQKFTPTMTPTNSENIAYVSLLLVIRRDKNDKIQVLIFKNI